jgi:hypothetical protein
VDGGEGVGEDLPGTALLDLGHVELEEAIEPREQLLPVSLSVPISSMAPQAPA